MDSESAQPDTGQDAQTSENGLYSPFLTDVPDDLHGQVIPALKAQNAEFTRKFQERAEKYGPFDETGVFDLDPENVTNLVALSDLLSAAEDGDEQAVGAVREWLDSVGENLGIYDNDDDDDVSVDEDFDPYDPTQIQRLVANAVKEQVAPIGQQISERERQQAEAQAVQQAEQAIEQSLAQIQEANPDLTDDDVGQIIQLAQLHAESSDNPIQAGFEQFKQLVSRGETNLFQSKQKQPSPAQGAGTNPVVPDKITSDNVAEIARQRLQAAMSQ